jgi:hypothetical protein
MAGREPTSAFLAAAERLLDLTISTAACSTLPLQSDEIGLLQSREPRLDPD